MADDSVEPAVSTTVSVAEFGVTVTTTNNTPSAGASVAFTGSTVPNTTQVDVYRWDFGDGTTAQTTGPSVSHVFTVPGTYTVTLTVDPVKGGSRFNSIIIVVS